MAWWPWGPEALAEAKRSNRPILLSIGYAACHWCHVMAHESFEDAGTAAVMNELFVNIKVDREERPEIDEIYMSALQHLGEQGGWPLTMFDARRRAVLGRHLFSEDRELWQARLSGRSPAGGAGFSRRAAKGRNQPRGAEGGASEARQSAKHGQARRQGAERHRRADRRVVRSGAGRPSRRAEIPSMRHAGISVARGASARVSIATSRW